MAQEKKYYTPSTTAEPISSSKLELAKETVYDEGLKVNRKVFEAGKQNFIALPQILATRFRMGNIMFAMKRDKAIMDWRDRNREYNQMLETNISKRLNRDMWTYDENKAKRKLTDGTEIINNIEKLQIELDDKYAERLALNKAKYHQYDQAQKELINTMSDRLIQGTTDFVGGLAQGVGDVTNLAKGAAFAAVASTAGTALGVGTIGKIGIEYGLDALDNYHTMYEEAILTDSPLPTREELIAGTITSLLVQGGFDAGTYAIRNVLNVKSNKLQNYDTETPSVDSTTTTAKEVVSEIVQDNHKDMWVQLELFDDKFNANSDIKYEPSRDPRNMRVDATDTIFDSGLIKDGGSYYVKTQDGVIKTTVGNSKIDQAKYDLRVGKITQEDYDKIVNFETLKMKDNVNKGLNINAENIPEVSQEISIKMFDDERIKVIEELSKPEVKIGDHAIVSVNGNSMMAFKDTNGSIVTLDFDDVNIKTDSKKNPNITNKSYQENMFDAVLKASRVSITQPDGTIKSVTGAKKLEYYFKFKTIQRLNELANVIVEVGDRIQSLENIDLTDDSVNAAVKYTTRNIADGTVNLIENATTQITYGNNKFFRNTIGQFYDNEEMLAKDVYRDALAEIFVKGKTDKDIFKSKTDMLEQKTQALYDYVNHLITTDTKLQAINKHMNLLPSDIDAADFQKYSKVIKIDSDGRFDYNTSEGGLFYDKDVNYTILDMMINPNKIDQGEYAKFIPDREVFDEVIGDRITLDRQNGMAMEVVFKDMEQELNLLEGFGFIKRDNVGDIISSPIDYLRGLSQLLEELYNPDSKYDQTMLKQIADQFTAMDKLPQRVVYNADGTMGSQTINLHDFILNNKNNGMVDKADMFAMWSDHINKLDDFISDVVQSNKGLVQEKYYDNAATKLNNDESNKVLSIINKWIKQFESENKANAYMRTDKFNKDKKKIEASAKILNISQPKMIDVERIKQLEPATYTGKIDDSNIVDNFRTLVEGTLEKKNKYKSISSLSQSLKDLIGRKKKIDDLVETEEFKSIVEPLKEQILDLDLRTSLADNLDSKNPSVVRQTIKDIQAEVDKFSKKQKSIEDAFDFIREKSKDNVMSDIVVSIKNRKPIKEAIKDLKEYNINREILSDVEDFVNYYGNEFDYKLDKDSTLNQLKVLRDELKEFNQSNIVEGYKEKSKLYSSLLKEYQRLKDVVNTDVSINSLKFFRTDKVREILDNIKSINNKLGYDINRLDSLDLMARSILDILEDIQDTTKFSPLKKLAQNFTSKYSKITNADLEIFGRLESVINKKRWLADKAMFNKTDNEIVRVLFEKIDNLALVPQGTFEEFINPKYQTKFKQFYDYAVKYFKEMEYYNDKGELIGSQPLTLDQFTVVYAHMLDDLTKTTKINKTADTIDPTAAPKYIKNLLPYFKDQDSMINMFTRRVAQLGEHFVDNNDTILYKFNRKNARTLAEYYTLGSTELGYGFKLNPMNKQAISALDRSAVSETIGDVTIVKDLKQKYGTILNVISDRLKNNAKPKLSDGSVQGVNERIWEHIVKGIANGIKDILIFGSGIKEISAVYNRTLGSMLIYDADGKILGTGKKYTPLRYMAAQGVALGKGLTMAAAYVPANIVNMSIGLSNMLLCLARYMRVEDGLNKLLKRPIHLEINKKYYLNPIKLYGKLSKKDKHMVSAMNHYFELKNLGKSRKYLGIDPREISFRDQKASYTATAFKHAREIFGETANLVQEQADMVRFIAAHENLNKIFDDLSSSTWDALPSQYQANLKLFGIDEKSFPSFLNVLNEYKTDNGFLDINLMNLELGINDLPVDKMIMVDAIQGFANHTFNKGFEAAKEMKYTPPQSGNLMQYINSIFRNTVYGMGLEDMQDAFYDLTSYGTYEPITNRFSRSNSKAQVLWNGTKVGFTTIPSKILMYTAIGMVAPVLNAAGKNILSLRRETAKSLGELQSFEDVIEDSEDNGEAICNGLSLLGSIYVSRAKEAFPITSIVNDGTVLDAYKPILEDTIREFHNVAYKTLGWGTDDVNRFWGKLGLNVKFDQINATDMTYGDNMMGLLKALVGKTFFKYPMDYYEFITKGGTLEKEYKDLRYLDRTVSDTTKFRIKTMYSKLGYVNADANNDPTLPTPKWEDLTEEGKKAEAKMLYDAILENNIQDKQSLIQHYDIAASEINHMLYENNLMSEQDYNDNKVEIYNNMEIDKQVDQMPEIYKYALDIVLDSYEDMSEWEELELKGSVVASVMQGSSFNDIINQFSNNPQKSIETINKDSKGASTPKRKTYPTFDNLPEILKYQYDELKYAGLKITEQEFLNKINSPSGKSWLKNQFDEDGKVKLQLSNRKEYVEPIRSTDLESIWVDENGEKILNPNEILNTELAPKQIAKIREIRNREYIDLLSL